MGAALELGFTTNLSHPGGNLTGVHVYGVETNGKLLQILKEAVPLAARVGVLSTEATGSDLYRSELRDYATKLQLSLIAPVLRDGTPQEIYQSTRFRLTLNINAAKAIDFTLPPKIGMSPGLAPCKILARADEVIE
jgi:hypothetical protein